MGLRSILVAFCLGITVIAAVPANAADDRPDTTPEPVTIRSSQQAAAAMECPSDMPNCTRTPRQHRRAFRRGNYGYADELMGYPSSKLDKIITLARRSHNRKYRNNWTRRETRRHFNWFRRHDNCVLTKGGNICPGRVRRSHRVAIKKVAVCGGEIGLIWMSGGSGLAWKVIIGGGLCGWTLVDPDFN